MNTETLSNLAIALEDAQKNPDMVAIFSFDAWGFPRDADDRDDQIHDAFEKQVESDEGFVDEESIDYLFYNDCIDNVITIIPHNCGAPACALGHYALRSDLQDFVNLDYMGSLKMNHVQGPKEAAMGVGDERIAAHFDISTSEAIKMFGSNGCNGAQTPGQAAEYIRDFIDHKRIRNRFGQEADREQE